MTAYFVPASDKTLLPPEQQNYSDLAALATDVEADVIQQFTVRVTDTWYTIPSLVAAGGVQVGAAAFGLYVMLLGYTVDAATADADLKDALKRTVADVVSWRIERRMRGQALASSGVQGVSRAYIEASAGLWPRGWDRRLRRFNLRVPVWGI